MNNQLRLEDLLGSYEDKWGNEVNKVAKFKWSELGPMGVFEMIDKRLLRVDDQYQRALKLPKCHKIAREFDWSVFGALTVNRRPDGTYRVIEGQHRVGGALLRDDITHVPCLVFQLDNIEKEAGSFSKINSTRTGLSGLERWKANIIMGDASTVIINSMILESGLRVGNGDNHVKCVYALLNEYEAGKEAFIAIWPLLVRLCDGNTITEGEVKGLSWLERNAAEGFTLADKHWNKALIPANLDDIRKYIKQQRALVNGTVAAGLGVLAFINRGRQNRFELKEKAKQA